MPHINLNDRVKVKLTAHGRATLAADHAAFWKAAGRDMPYVPPKEDRDGWSEWQLWDLMQRLGPHTGLACVLPIETDLQIAPFEA